MPLSRYHKVKCASVDLAIGSSGGLGCSCSHPLITLIRTFLIMQRRRPPPFLRVLPIECGLKPLSVHSKSRIEASSLLRAVTTTEPLHEAHRDVKIIEIRIVRKCVSVVSEPMVRSSKWTPVDILRLPKRRSPAAASWGTA